MNTRYNKVSSSIEFGQGIGSSINERYSITFLLWAISTVDKTVFRHLWPVQPSAA